MAPRGADRGPRVHFSAASGTEGLEVIRMARQAAEERRRAAECVPVAGALFFSGLQGLPRGSPLGICAPGDRVKGGPPTIVRRSSPSAVILFGVVHYKKCEVQPTMPISRSRRVFFWSALVLLIVAVGLFAVACGSTATTTTTAAPATTATTAAPAQTTTTTAPAGSTTTVAASKPFTFGLVLVGPYNDHGWSQANYEGGQYVEQKLPGSKMIYVDKANSSDRPGTTASQLAEDLVNQGAQMIFFTSDDFKDEAVKFAKAHPDIPVEFTSGDTAWKDGKDYQNLPNLSDIMGKMEYGKMIAGVAAALDHPDRQDRLSWSADQRRDPPPCFVRLPRALSTNGRKYLKKDPAAAEVHRQLDRLLVQHPGRHLRPHPGGRQLLQLGL